MKSIFTLFLLSTITFIFISCNNNRSPSSCMENPDPDRKFLVIVGEKIDIKEEKALIDSSTFLHFSKYTARYRIIEKVCGDYNEDTISFAAYDHYGYPAFGKYRHVLLYLVVTRNGILHEQYQYSALYKTKDGRWASPYSALAYGYYKSNNTTVKPEEINFDEEVSFSIEGFTRAYTKRWYPEPFFKIDKQRKKAIAVLGNYVPELFQLKKETTLKGRGIFGNPDTTKLTVREVKLEDIEELKLSKKDSFALMKTWQSLITAIKQDDKLLIKNLSFDSITCSICQGMPREYYENNLESIDMFIDSAAVNFDKASLWPIIENNQFTISVTKYVDEKPTEIQFKDGEGFVIYGISFAQRYQTVYGHNVQGHTFEFVKVDGKFRFYKMKSQ